METVDDSSLLLNIATISASSSVSTTLSEFKRGALDGFVVSFVDTEALWPNRFLGFASALSALLGLAGGDAGASETGFFSLLLNDKAKSTLSSLVGRTSIEFSIFLGFLLESRDFGVVTAFTGVLSIVSEFVSVGVIFFRGIFTLLYKVVDPFQKVGRSV